MRWTARLNSLQARLLALLLLVVTLVWLGAVGKTWFDVDHELEELLDGHLAQAAALLIAQQSVLGAQAEPHADVDARAQELVAPNKYANRVAFQVFHEGKLTLHSNNAGITPMAELKQGFVSVLRSDHTQWRVFATHGHEADVQVFVGELSSARDDLLWSVLQGVLMPLLYALPLLALVAWVAVRKGLAPLRQLSQALARRQAQALEALALRDVPSEIAPVVESLNALFKRIENMLASERRFTADAAHELRTPIAAIRAQAQVALGALGDSAQRDNALHYTLAGCDRAAHLVEQLLTLSRLEGSSASAPVGLVNLSALAQQVAAELALTALEREQELVLEAPAAHHITADTTLTSVLIRNLLDNALRYSPDGAKVSLAVSQAEGYVQLQVDDSGAGLTNAEMARLGERFYRVLGSGQSGSGLGWSIVRRIAAVYAAQLSVQRSTQLGGLCVSVRWPHAPAPASSAPAAD